MIVINSLGPSDINAMVSWVIIGLDNGLPFIWFQSIEISDVLSWITILFVNRIVHHRWKFQVTKIVVHDENSFFKQISRDLSQVETFLIQTDLFQMDDSTNMIWKIPVT